MRCPAYVTPSFLEEAKGQSVCADERDKYYCNVACTTDGQVNWVSSVCPNDLVSPCPPWKRTVVPEFDPKLSPAPPTAIHGPETEEQAAALTAPAAPAKPSQLRGDKFSGANLVAQASPADADIVKRTGGFDLRGAVVGAPVLTPCTGCADPLRAWEHPSAHASACVAQP